MSQDPPCRASVIIVSYNSRKHLENGLSGIHASLGKNDELILVDNASSDGCAKWASREFPRIRLIAAQKNLGFGGANHLGVEHARGEFVVFINPDTEVEPSWLEGLIQPLQTSTEIQLTTSRIVLMSDPETVNACGNDFHITGVTLCRGMGRPRDEFDTAGFVNAVSGAAFAMRRDLYLRLGGYDADFFLYMEDTDLSLRARLAGARSAFVPRSIVRHAYELRFASSKTYYQERNRYILLLKLYRWGTLAVLLPVLLLGEVVTWGYVLLRERERLGNKFKAYAWILCNWKSIMNKRTLVQRQRTVPDRVLIAETTSRLEIAQVESTFLGKTATAIFSVLFAIFKIWARIWVWW